MKKNCIFVIFFLGLCIGFFVVLEGIFRLTGVGYNTEPFERVPHTPYYRDNADFLNKYYPGRKTPRSEAKYKNLFLVKKPTNGFRAFIIGGSTAQGWPFEPNQSFGKMIEVALQKNLSNYHIEVINVAYSAMSSYYVADVVRRLFRYKPDVILIYTGQNEYYGTLSLTTGGSHQMKWFYLMLREWRLFQILFGLFEQKTNPSLTMMANQFAGKKIASGKIDKNVAENFSRNLRKTFSQAEKHHAPIIIYEMAANLIHMPPFASIEEEKVKPLILSHDTLFRRNTWQSEATKKLLENWQNHYPSNAHVLYLDGLAKRARGEKFLDILVSAKDHDIIPFRFREILRHTLLKEAHKTSNIVTVIPLYQEILRYFGEEGFGRQLFIDHLHFNATGQRFLAKLATEAILSRVFTNQTKNVNDFFFKEKKEKTKGIAHAYEAYEEVLFTFYDEFIAIQNILTLIHQSPYKEMLIPFPKDPSWGELAMIKEPLFRGIFDSYHQTKEKQAFGNFLLTELAKKQQWEIIELLLEAYRHNNPGSSVAYQNLAEFFASQKKHEKALSYCAMAYLLADTSARKPLKTFGKKLALLLGNERHWETHIQLLAKNPWYTYNKTTEKRRHP